MDQSLWVKFLDWGSWLLVAAWLYVLRLINGVEKDNKALKDELRKEQSDMKSQQALLAQRQAHLEQLREEDQRRYEESRREVRDSLRGIHTKLDSLTGGARDPS